MFRYTLYFITAVFAVIQFPAGAPAYDLRTNGEGIPLRWVDIDAPIPYFIERGGCVDISDGSEFTAIQSAFQTWENVATGSVEFRFLGLADRNDLDPRASVILWMEEEWPYDTKYIAKTRLYYSKRSGRILKVEMMLNGRDYRWSTNGEEGTLDVQNVATHEVGHFIGFGDIRTSRQTMFEYITPGEIEKIYLSEDELDGLQAAYPLIAEDREVILQTYTLSIDGGMLNPADREVTTIDAGGFLALCPLGKAGSRPIYLGIIRADDEGSSLTVIGPHGNVLRRYDLLLGNDVKAGRIRAVSSLDLDGDGTCSELAAIISTPDGLNAFLGILPAFWTKQDEIRMVSLPIRGADELVAFAPLESGESEIGNAVVVAEKRRNSEFYLSLTRAIRDGEEEREITLKPLRSWRVPDCNSLLGVTTRNFPTGESEVLILLRNSAGVLELVFYSSPFARFSGNGEVMIPTRRLDASVIDNAGKPLALSASGISGTISVIVAR